MCLNITFKIFVGRLGRDFCPYLCRYPICFNYYATPKCWNFQIFRLIWWFNFPNTIYTRTTLYSGAWSHCIYYDGTLTLPPCGVASDRWGGTERDSNKPQSILRPAVLTTSRSSLVALALVGLALVASATPFSIEFSVCSPFFEHTAFSIQRCRSQLVEIIFA